MSRKKKADFSRLTPFEKKILKQLAPTSQENTIGFLDALMYRTSELTADEWFFVEGDKEGSDLVLLAESHANGVAPEDWDASEPQDGQTPIEVGMLAEYFTDRLTGKV